MGNVTVRDSTGAALDVPEEQLPAYVARGYKPEGGEQQAERLGAEHRTEEYGGPVGTFAAAGLGALGTVTGGGSDAALAGLGGGRVLRSLREENPLAATGGALAGAFVPTGLVGAAGRVGAGVTEGLGAGLAARAAGAAAEGGLYGAGAAVTDLSLSQDPLTWERAASSIGSNVLFGAGLGGGVGLATGAVERGLLGAKRLIDARLAQREAGAAASDALAAAPASPIPSAEQIAAAGGEITSTVPAASLHEYGWYEPGGQGADVVKADAARTAIREGQREPITMVVDKDGNLQVVDGRNRLAAAVEQDAPIAVRWEQGGGLAPTDVAKGKGLGRLESRPPLDVGALDQAGLKAARKAEIDAIDAQSEPLRKRFVHELDTYRNTNRDAHDLREIARGSGDRDVVEAGSSFTRADMKLRKLLDVRSELAAQPERALNILQQQEQALEEIRQWGTRQKQAWQADMEAAPERIRREILAGKVPEEKGPFGKVGPGAGEGTSGLDLAVQRQIAERSKLQWDPGGKGPFHEGYALKEPAYSRHEADYAAAIDTNKRLQAKLEDIMAAPQTRRLAQIEAAERALSAPAPKKTLGERLLHHVPGGNLVSEIAGIGSKATNSLKAAVGKAAVRTGEAVSAFAGKAAPAVAKSTPVATKVLSELSYGAVPKAAANANAVHGSELAVAFKARTDEIKQQTAYDESGIPRIRPEAREALASRLQPVRVANPILGDRLETLAVRRLEYLSSLIPRRPDFGGIQTGPSTWQPSDMEMRTFARSAWAAEHPGGVEDRVANGTVTPEDAAAYWAVHPERARSFVQQIMATLPGRTKPLPYRQRLSLAIFTGQPVDPSMHPRVFATLQGQFPAEPGSAGGTQAPKANPAFGSLKKSPDAPTPAQHRATGART